MMNRVSGSRLKLDDEFLGVGWLPWHVEFVHPHILNKKCRIIRLLRNFAGAI
jgi:hypothetical protein